MLHCNHMDDQRTTIDISLLTVIKIVGVLLGLWFLFVIRDIVLLLFLVIIIVMALAPIIDRWQRYMSRGLAVGLLFVIILAIFTLVISLLVPPLASQIGELANNLPGYADHLQQYLASQSDGAHITQRAIQTLSDQLSGLSQGFLTATLGILGGLVTFFTAIVLSAYLLYEEQGIRKFIISVLPIEQKEAVVSAINKVGDKLGSWLRGQLMLMLIIGTMATIWASILGLPYALTLGIWAGLTEVIPFVGPILGGIPIVLLALVDSPLKALLAVVLLGLTQQTESNFIVPKVMQKSVGLSPVIVILALLIGGRLFGITGTILSVPLAATLSVAIQEWPKIAKTIKRSKN